MPFRSSGWKARAVPDRGDSTQGRCKPVQGRCIPSGRAALHRDWSGFGPGLVRTETCKFRCANSSLGWAPVEAAPGNPLEHRLEPANGAHVERHCSQSVRHLPARAVRVSSVGIGHLECLPAFGADFWRKSAGRLVRQRSLPCRHLGWRAKRRAGSTIPLVTTGCG